eukprot:m.194705 g.194705  ORF g.194705 m.194705 type:complete len:1260 (-) comp13661_c0_seq1:157-3936(-)
MSSNTITSTSEFEENRHLMDLYSRQIGAFGVETMVKLVQMKVLFIGVNGVCVEAAKNTTLAGAHTVSLFDNNSVEMRHLGSNFFLTEDDISKNVASVVAPRLAQLNPLVRVNALQGEITDELLHRFDVVVVCDKTATKEKLNHWNEVCRTRTKVILNKKGDAAIVPQPSSFIYCFSGGLFGSVFVDHGDNFVVRDRDGKEPLVKIITSMERKVETIKDDNGNELEHHYTLVKFITPDGQQPGSLRENGLVDISDVEGMVALNPETVQNCGPTIGHSGPWRTSTKPTDPVNSVRIGDTRGFSMYVSGGFITEVKEPQTINFRSFAQCCVEPSNKETGVFEGEMQDYGFVMTDFMSLFNSGGPEVQTHFALQAVHAFLSEHGRLPEVNNKEEAKACVEHAKKINGTLQHFAELMKGSDTKICHVDEVNEKFITSFAIHCGVEIQPMSAAFGGIVAQEIVKISGRFTPIRQFLNINALDAYPDEEPTDTQPTGSRYDDQIAVFGKSFQEKLGGLKMFMVGCGALGCEFLKNFAMMGLCCGKDGLLHVTDNDRIEISNLSRQFLFREDNVGHPKSEAATKRAQSMNPSLNVNARQDLVGKDTEHIFDDAFWEGLDLVCNALDNMKAREYVDNQCVLYEKPLLESGTMGTGANVDVIIPHVTTSYSDGGSAEEGGGIPMCTLRNFPHLIDHCIEWARAKFTDLYVTPPTQLQQFLEDPGLFLSNMEAKIDESFGGERIGALERGVSTLTEIKSLAQRVTKKPTIEMCVGLAWKQMHTFFRDNILDLVATFPVDAKTKSGEPFWSGHKMFPKEFKFDPNNDLHVSFLIAATNLFASVFKVHPEKYPSEKNSLHKERWMVQFRDVQWLNGVLAGMEVPEYVRHKVSDLDDASKADAEDDAGDDGEEGDVEEVFETLCKEMHELGKSLTGVGVSPLDFEKDDDDNFHIDFIYAASNLRAANYSIPVASRHKCKMIAGRIIPAIATSTASVTGLVMIELLKLVQKKPIEKYNNANYDLGTNTYFHFEPNPAKKNKTYSKKEISEFEYQSAIEKYNKELDAAVSKKEELEKLQQLLTNFNSSSSEIEKVEEALKEVNKSIESIPVPVVENYEEEEVFAFYPEGFTKWDKIVLPQDADTVKKAVDHLESTHKLTVDAWFINGKKVFPPKPKLNLSLLPSLDTSMNDGVRQLMRTAGTQAATLIGEWRKAKSSGVLPKMAKEEGDNVDGLVALCKQLGIDTDKKRLLVFSDIAFTNEDGDAVTTPPVIYHL